ncbi:hypothetical protein CTAYLR_001241 [Chrysophaeum taylorii]|uniref:Uncharacterized protein n=1 Tax=Chrysophaeum taylorii TaxID=2483200 RepID=A0AAD7XNN9_9STRA|nr:hypothetical protein CTAYLR_001241 [Chrysophaeum taylorii]
MAGKGLVAAIKYGVVGVVVAVALGQGRLLFTLALRATSGPLDLVVGTLPGINEAELARSASGKSFLVVGGTRGIGRGIVTAIVRLGGSCTIVGRRGAAARAREVVASPGRVFVGHDVDLSTVAGCVALSDALSADGREFDVVVFTVGAWPNFSDPTTTDGLERVLQLDLLARHLVLKRLARDDLLSEGAVVVNTLASTVMMPFVSKIGVKVRLERSRPPATLATSLPPIAVAADAYLLAAATHLPARITYVGMFPGVVNTDVMLSTFPAWAVAILHALQRPISISEDETALTHLAVAMSPNCRRRRVSYWNYLLEARATHRLAYEADLADFVWNFLETTSARLAPPPDQAAAIP